MPARRTLEFGLRPARVLSGMLAAISALLVANVAGILSLHLDPDAVYQKLVPFFDFRAEHNFPTLYSSLAILFCSGLLGVIGFSTRPSDRKASNHWLVLAAVFAFLALDELLAFHEHLIVPVRDLLGTSGLLHWPWMIPYGIATAALGLFYLPWLWRLPRRSQRLFAISGLVYLSGAVGFEMLGAREAELYGTRGAVFGLLYTLEELFEMLGVAIFAYALLAHIDAGLPSITIRTRSRSLRSR